MRSQRDSRGDCECKCSAGPKTYTLAAEGSEPDRRLNGQAPRLARVVTSGTPRVSADYGPRSRGGLARRAGVAFDATPAGHAIIVWTYSPENGTTLPGKRVVSPHNKFIMDCRGAGMMRTAPRPS